MPGYIEKGIFAFRRQKDLVITLTPLSDNSQKDLIMSFTYFFTEFAYGSLLLCSRKKEANDFNSANTETYFIPWSPALSLVSCAVIVVSFSASLGNRSWRRWHGADVSNLAQARSIWLRSTPMTRFYKRMLALSARLPLLQQCHGNQLRLLPAMWLGGKRYLEHSKPTAEDWRASEIDVASRTTKFIALMIRYARWRFSRWNWCQSQFPATKSKRIESHHQHLTTCFYLWRPLHCYPVAVDRQWKEILIRSATQSCQLLR